MRRRQEASGREVQLLNVPSYTQGTFDGMCLYYTGAMMLATLFPEYSYAFGESKKRAVARMSHDPLIKNYIDHTSVGEDDRAILARWYYLGETVERLVKILNKIMRSDRTRTTFQYSRLNNVDTTFERIVENIERGLPVILGWSTEDYGDHAVLVVGYWIGNEKWLLTRDPSGSEDISWDSLASQQDGRFDAGMCTSHWGPRPMKLIVQGRRPVVHQWMPKQEYTPIKDLFKKGASFKQAPKK